MIYIHERDGNDFYKDIANSLIYFGSNNRYRWQSQDGSKFSDYIVIPEVTEPGTGDDGPGGYTLYKPIETIAKGETKSIKLGNQVYWDGIMTVAWIMSDPFGSTIQDTINTEGWSISFNDSTGMFTITPPLNAIPGNYFLTYYSNSTDHGHNHQTSVWFEVPCVKIIIHISQSEGA